MSQQDYEKTNDFNYLKCSGCGERILLVEIVKHEREKHLQPEVRKVSLAGKLVSDLAKKYCYGPHSLVSGGLEGAFVDAINEAIECCAQVADCRCGSAWHVEPSSLPRMAIRCPLCDDHRETAEGKRIRALKS